MQLALGRYLSRGNAKRIAFHENNEFPPSRPQPPRRDQNCRNRKPDSRYWPSCSNTICLCGKKTLKILQWSHFVPAYDKWFNNEYVKEWGDKNDTEVTVDNINRV